MPAREREPLLDAQVKDAQRLLEIEGSRDRVGSRDQRTVTQQELAVFSTRSTPLRVQAERRVQRVNLSLALDGGFGPVADASSAQRAQEKQP